MANNNLQEIVNWDWRAVENYLNKNKIFGCEQILMKNNVDGRTFLGLDAQALTNWGVRVVLTAKILALLNSLGPESYRKHLSATPYPSAAKPKIPSKPQNKPTSFGNIPVATVKPIKNLGYPNVEKPAVPPSKSKPPQSSVSSPPILPPKPPHLKQQQNHSISSAAIVESGNGKYINYPDEENYEEPISNSSVPEPYHSEDDFSSDDDLSEQNNYEPIDDLDDPLSPPSPPSRIPVLSPSPSQNSLGSDKFNSRHASQELSQQSGRKKISQPNLVEMPPSKPPPPLLPSQSRNYPNLAHSNAPSHHQVQVSGSSLSPPPHPNGRHFRGASPSHSDASGGDSAASNSSESGPSTRVVPNLDEPWYFNVERKQAESTLIKCTNGTFLVRPSKHGGKDSVMTLSLQYDRRIFHVLIRRRSDGKLALGTKKDDEDTFQSLSELIHFHKTTPLNLHSNGELAGTTCLIQWPDNIF